ncbi:unnamed protein product [Pylaiella littoralis]
MRRAVRWRTSPSSSPLRQAAGKTGRGCESPLETFQPLRTLCPPGLYPRGAAPKHTSRCLSSSSAFTGASRAAAPHRARPQHLTGSNLAGPHGEQPRPPKFCLPTLRPIISASPSSSSSFRAGRLAPASSGVGRRCSPPVPSLGGTGVGRAGARGRAGVLLPAGEALKGAGVRGFGVVDSVQDKIINRNAAKQEKQFKEQMDKLSLMKGFDMDDFAKIIEEPLDKVSAKLPWNKNREELQKMKMQKKVLDALTPLQRKKPDSIRPGHRQVIADRAGVTAEEVNGVLASFRELRAMQAWLSTRRKRGEKIPTSQEEMHVLATAPSGTMLMSFMKIKRGGSGNASLAF